MNYQLALETIIQEIEGKEQRLLLHSCCGPCSSYVLEYLSGYFDITILYYNPNIAPMEEYLRRLEEQRALLNKMGLGRQVDLIEYPYTPSEFYEAVKGDEALPEKGRRCYKCYQLRMERVAKVAVEKAYDYFTTTLSISPHKNAQWINEIGEALSQKYHIHYLYADFKKKNGYKRSLELSSQYGLYRQDYCGCIFSNAATNKFKK